MSLAVAAKVAAAPLGPVASDPVVFTENGNVVHSGDIFAIGSHTITATATDAHNNSSSTSFTIKVQDTTPPSAAISTQMLASDTGASSTDRITSNGAVTLTGTDADAVGVASVHVLDGTTDLGAATLNGDGTWSFSTTLAQGSHALSAKATDTSGNSSTTAAAPTILVDQTAPSETFATVTLISDTGSSATDFITSNGGVHFAGTVSDSGGAGIDTVRVFNGATLLGTATVSAAGWSLDTTLAEGAYSQLEVIATDLAGNSSSASNGQAIIIDQTDPGETISSTIGTDTGLTPTISSGGLTKDNTLALSGTVDDANGVASVHVFDGATDLGAATITGSIWSFTTTALADGLHSFTARATDVAGNATTTSAVTGTVDTTADLNGDLAVSFATNNAAVPGDVNAAHASAASFSVSGLDADATATVTFSGISKSTGTTTTVTKTLAANGSSTVDLSGFKDGTITAAISATDTASNTANGAGASTVLDTTADVGGDLAVSFAATNAAVPGDVNAAHASAASFSVAGLDADATATATFSGISKSTGTTTTVTKTLAANGSSTVDLSGFKDGTITAAISATDTASNTANGAGASALLDTTAPTVTSITVTNSQGNNRTVEFTFSEAVTGFDSADVTVNKGVLGTVTPIDASHYTEVITNATGNPDNIQVVASGTGTSSWTDLAGNGGLGSSLINIHPAGIAGDPITLALNNPTHAGPIAVTVEGLLPDWSPNSGTLNPDGTWSVTTTDPSTLTVATPSNFAGAAVLNVTETWTNTDGSIGTAFITDNVEAYAPGSPIFAVSGDDNLTGSSGADTFVFAQPIGNDTVFSFDAAADKIDLIGFAGLACYGDLAIADDANGNARVTLGAGGSITLKGVDASALSAANFEFEIEPVTENPGTMTIGDGAMLPLGGTVDNTGTVALSSTGDETDLEILVHGLTLEGGGTVTLSDSSQNAVFGGDPAAVLTNIDNTILGAGRIGQGQLTLDNRGTILANGSNALVIDTGANVIANSGILEATGAGGLQVKSDIANTGELWANGGNVTVSGAVMGSGTAEIDGSAMLEFAGASSAATTFGAGASGTLKLDQSGGFSGTIAGFAGGDGIDLGDVGFGSSTALAFAANADGSGGTLTVSDGTHTANLQLLGQYAATGFQAAADAGTGTMLTYVPQEANAGGLLTKPV
jgi:hypothetical protein